MFELMMPTADQIARNRRARQSGAAKLKAKRAAGKVPRLLHKEYKEPARGKKQRTNLNGEDASVVLKYVSARPLANSGE